MLWFINSKDLKKYIYSFFGNVSFFNKSSLSLTFKSHKYFACSFYGNAFLLKNLLNSNINTWLNHAHADTQSVCKLFSRCSQLCSQFFFEINYETNHCDKKMEESRVFKDSDVTCFRWFLFSNCGFQWFQRSGKTFWIYFYNIIFDWIRHFAFTFPT